MFVLSDGHFAMRDNEGLMISFSEGLLERDKE